MASIKETAERIAGGVDRFFSDSWPESRDALADAIEAALKAERTRCAEIAATRAIRHREFELEMKAAGKGTTQFEAKVRRFEAAEIASAIREGD